MVLIGLDYGTKHMGVSVGDTISKQAQPLSGFSYVNDGWFEPLQSIVEQWQPEKIVIGLPLNADGSRQPLTDQVLTFVKVLEEKIGLQKSGLDPFLKNFQTTHREICIATYVAVHSLQLLWYLFLMYYRSLLLNQCTL